MPGEVALYSAVDAVLTHYAVDVEAATLTQQASIELPAKVQYAWPHPTHRVLYVTTSAGGPRVRSDHNHVSALAIGPRGELRPFGTARPLPHRAVHLCVDPAGRHILNAHNFQGGGITVHRIEQDHSLGAEIAQDTALDLGIYPHQVMVFPSGRTVLLVDRGNKRQEGKAEDPGALRCFPFADGALAAGPVVAPGGGYGFGPRHVAFHPTQPWLYASDERTNRLYMFGFAADRLEPEPRYTRDTLAEPGAQRPRQIAGPIHVHPSGRFVYVANRADYIRDDGSGKAFGGGENSVAVFALDPATGEPTPIQHAPTGSFHIRTFSLDPTGRLLVTASVKPMPVREQERIRIVSAGLAVFRIGGDGRLDHVRTHEVQTGEGQMQYWSGMVGLG
jgi:6-phosphogluconolactonase (cycloisomerase 2 family)